MSRRLTRRSFLAASAAAAAGLALPGLLKRAGAASMPAVPLPARPTDPEWEFIQPHEARQELWGRITDPGYPVRAEPGLNKEVVRFLHAETVLPLLGTLEADGFNPNNKLWYRIEDGFLYTSGVQVIKPYRMPTIVTEITTVIDDEPGFWAEVIVPSTIPYFRPNGERAYDEVLDQRIPLTHYYGSVHRIIDVEQDGAGNFWYKAYDDKPQRPPVFVLARHLRAIPVEAFEPINPGADKKMIIDLTGQRINCYEGDELVYSVLTSSGAGGYPTPTGEHAVVYKQPSRHMYSDPGDPVSGGDIDDDFFDLPGVPFNIFLTTLGHAIHGTWWHGDYGRPRSHGCLNVTPEAAHWLYRWVEPVASYSESAAGSAREPGTPIIVVD